jgi:uncharacterized protein YdaT
LTRRKPARRGAGQITAMPWTEERYPVAMRRLPALVRSKAIEIANALLAEGIDEGRAIRIAIARAKTWAERHAGVDPRRGR